MFGNNLNQYPQNGQQYGVNQQMVANEVQNRAKKLMDDMLAAGNTPQYNFQVLSKHRDDMAFRQNNTRDPNEYNNIAITLLAIDAVMTAMRNNNMVSQNQSNMFQQQTYGTLNNPFNGQNIMPQQNITRTTQQGVQQFGSMLGNNQHQFATVNKSHEKSHGNEVGRYRSPVMQNSQFTTPLDNTTYTNTNCIKSTNVLTAPGLVKAKAYLQGGGEIDVFINKDKKEGAPVTQRIKTDEVISGYRILRRLLEDIELYRLLHTDEQGYLKPAAIVVLECKISETLSVLDPSSGGVPDEFKESRLNSVDLDKMINSLEANGHNYILQLLTEALNICFEASGLVIRLDSTISIDDIYEIKKYQETLSQSNDIETLNNLNTALEVWTKIYEEWTVNTFIQETSIDDKQVKVKYESLDRPLIAINVRYGSIYKSLTENGVLDNAVKITKDSYPDLYESIDSVYNHGNTVIIYGTTHSTNIKDKYGTVIKFKDEYWLKNI